MIQPYSIRLLTLNDLPAFKALRDAALRDFPDAFTSDFETARLLSADSYATRISAPGEYGLLPRAICVAGTFYDNLLMRKDLSALRDHHCL